MFTSKGCNKESIENVKDHSGLIPNVYESSFYDISSILNQKTVHQHCIDVLLTQVYICPLPWIDEWSLIIGAKTIITYAI